MISQSILTRADYENYLVYLYFGSDSDLEIACIRRAYRDFNRTMHVLRRFENTQQLKDQAEAFLRSSLESLKTLSATATFDAWHRSTCETMILRFQDHGFRLFVGQAQKWINMTLKYVFTLGEARLPSYEPVYPYCHVPLDNILLERLRKYGFPALDCAWSRLDNYDDYLQRQDWIRQRFAMAPMDVEFLLWLGTEIDNYEQC